MLALKPDSFIAWQGLLGSFVLRGGGARVDVSLPDRYFSTSLPSPSTACNPAEPWVLQPVHTLERERVPRPVLWLPKLTWLCHRQELPWTNCRGFNLTKNFIAHLRSSIFIHTKSHLLISLGCQANTQPKV